MFESASVVYLLDPASVQIISVCLPVRGDNSRALVNGIPYSRTTMI